jgi:hypothetical protein
MSRDKDVLTARQLAIHAAYLAGRDSPHHTPETKRAWRRLYERDIRRVLGTPWPEPADNDGAGTDQE